MGELQYRVLQENNAAALAREVEERLHKGWKLQGGVSINSHPMGQTSFSQAITRQPPESP